MVNNPLRNPVSIVRTRAEREFRERDSNLACIYWAECMILNSRKVGGPDSFDLPFLGFQRLVNQALLVDLYPFAEYIIGPALIHQYDRYED